MTKHHAYSALDPKSQGVEILWGGGCSRRVSGYRYTPSFVTTLNIKDTENYLNNVELKLSVTGTGILHFLAVFRRNYETQFSYYTVKSKLADTVLYCIVH